MNGAEAKQLKKYAAAAVIVFSAVLLYRVLEDPEKVRAAWGTLRRAAEPVFFGLSLAFAADLPVRAIETKVLKGLASRRPRLARGIAMAVSYAAILGALALVVSLVVPKAIESLRLLASNLGDWIAAVSERMDGMKKRLEPAPEICEMLERAGASAAESALRFAEELAPKLPSFTVSAIGGVFRALLAAAVSVHAVACREKLARFFKRSAAALLPEGRREGVLREIGLAAGTFRRYLTGQAASCLIVGLLCYIGMRVTSMPYPELISAFICIGALVPVVGPWASTLPSALVILMAEQDKPITALWFLLMIGAIQLIDDNLVCPRIVGDAVGVPAILVISSVAVGGALFGFPGVVFAVPTAAVAKRLFSRWTARRLGRA